MFEQLSRGCVSTAAFISIHNMAAWMIDSYGSGEQRERWIPPLMTKEKIASYCLTEPGAGSDAGSLKTKAVKDGDDYILNGSKTFITNPNYSDFHVVMARTDPEKGKAGISAFILENDMPGFTVGAPMNKLGMRASDTAEMFFEDCRVPAKSMLGNEGQGYYNSLSILDGGRIGIASMCLGIARGAYEHAVRYSQERSAFGKTISNFQAIKIKLADMATQIDAARLLVHRAAWMKDQKMNVNLESAMAKLFASEVAVNVANEAVQVFGGYGYIK